MPSKKPDPIEQLSALRSYFDSLEQKPEDTLTRLAEKTDPGSLERKLSLLLELGRTEEAASLARSSPLHEYWVEKGIEALVADGDVGSAKVFLRWMAENAADQVLANRAAVKFASSVLGHVVKRPETESRPVVELSQDHRSLLEEALSSMAAITATVRDSKKTRNALEKRAAEIALEIHRALGQQSELEEYAKSLVTYHPVPLSLASVALEGVVEPPRDLVERLRSEHPDSPEAQSLADLAEAQLFGRPEEAFENVRQRIPKAASEQERRGLGRTLQLLSQSLGDDALAKIEEIRPFLPPDDERLEEVVQAVRLLGAGDLDGARELLETSRSEESPYWLQAYASYLVARGDENEAVDFAVKAANLLPDPELLRKAGGLAFRCGRLSEATEMLEQLVLLLPGEVEARQSLAMVYRDSGDLDKAAKQFEALRMLEPSVSSHALNEAVCHIEGGQLARALELLDAHLSAVGPRLAPLLEKARLLRAMNRAQEAYDHLAQYKDEFWDNPIFLVSMIEASYAAEKEDVAHEVMQRVLALQAENKLDEPVLESKSIEEITELIEEHREQERTLLEGVARGTMPWLLADEILGHVPCWSWRIRTQPVPWVAESEQATATYSVFATNSFALATDGLRAGTLARLEAPEPGSVIVADLSAILTLDRLGLLEKLTDYAQQVLLPQSYLSRLVSEKARLTHHQPSRARSLRMVRTALEIGELSEAAAGEEQDERRLDEYSDRAVAASPLRIRDLIETLYQSGRLNDLEYEDLGKFSLKTGSLATESPLALGATLSVELATLLSLVEKNLLEKTLSSFEVKISPKDRDELAKQLRAVDEHEEMYRWHEDLWSRIQNEPQFSFVADPSSPDEDEDHARRRDSASLLAAVQIAVHRKEPLLADDRLCQTVALNEAKDPAGAFGTGQLLLALKETGAITDQELATAYLQLLEWRYRYLVVPSEVLITLAGRYREHPPGADLLEVRRYLHGCFNCPGLSTGFWPGTEPPVSMAVRFFQAWTAEIVHFIMDVWEDNSFTDSRAAALTKWAVIDLLPPLPYIAEYSVMRMLSGLDRYIMGRALLRAVFSDNQSRANQGLRELGKYLDFDDDAYIETLAGVVHDHRPRS